VLRLRSAIALVAVMIAACAEPAPNPAAHALVVAGEPVDSSIAASSVRVRTSSPAPSSESRRASDRTGSSDERHALATERCRRAEKVVRAIFEGRSDEAAAAFAAPLRASLPPAKLDTIRSELGSIVGAFERVERTRPRAAGLAHGVVVVARFDRGSVAVRLALDEADAVAGLLLTGLDPPWTAPPYAPPHAVDEALAPSSPSAARTVRWVTRPRTARAGGRKVVIVTESALLDDGVEDEPRELGRDVAWGLAARGHASVRWARDPEARVGPELVGLGEAIVADAAPRRDRASSPSTRDDAGPVLVLQGAAAALAPRLVASGRFAAIALLAAAPRSPVARETARLRERAMEDGEVSEVERARLERIDAAARELARGTAASSLVDAPLVLGRPLADWGLAAWDEPSASMSQLDLPVLVALGETDVVVPEDDRARWATALAGRPHAAIRSFPQLAHDLAPRAVQGPDGPRPQPVDRSVIDALASWLDALPTR
jgi:hypothetical protein